MKTLTKEQIKAVGDAVINWVEQKLGTNWLSTTLVLPIMEGLRSSWDTAGADDVAKFLTDMGWTVS